MSIVTTNNAYYLAIANAIRSKTGTTNLIYPSQMANLISEISENRYILINVRTDSTSPTGAAMIIRTYKVDVANKRVLTQSIRRIYTQDEFTMEGITIYYDHINQNWELLAALDYVYYNGEQYGYGAGISTWGYNKRVDLWMYI